MFKMFKDLFPRQELLMLTNEVSYIHRIQGSEGIEEAADLIYGFVKELGVFDVELHTYEYSRSYGNLQPLTGWWVRDAVLRMVKPYEKLLHSFSMSRTLVVAHSPGGEVRAKVVNVGLGDRAKHYEGVDVEGKAVLACGNVFLAYREACRRGASLVLLYRDDLPEDAVPYLSLFLRPEDISWAKALALSISRRTAYEIIRHISYGDEVVVEASVEAGFRGSPKIKVVTARLGDVGTEVHLLAHYCHPGGTVNDNVSGTVALLGLSKVLSKAVNDGRIPQPKKHDLVIIWCPEYYGSVAYLTSRPVDNVVFSINLDMIGEKQDVTGSTLNYVRPPPRLFHPYEAVVYYELRNALSNSSTFSSPKKLISYRFDVTPYEVGSDHDIYIVNGIPAVMINQWPDTYYHTDLDSIDKFDPEITTLISSAVGSATYKLLLNKLDKSLITSYVFEYLGSETSWVSDDVRTYRLHYLHKVLRSRLIKYLNDDLGLGGLNISYDGLTSGGVGIKYFYRGPPDIIRLKDVIASLGEEDLNYLETIFRGRKYLRTVIQVLIPLLLKEPKTIDELKSEVIGELGVDIEYEVLERLVNILVKLNYLARVVT
jgi:Zn-dependent M28 family amino/carboxypeptidase